MVRDGFYYAAGLLIVALLLWKLTGSMAIGIIPLLLACFFLWFFRDPPRRIPSGPGEIVSPGDGKVTEADWIETPQGSFLRLSIFLSVFDVHVNRSPIKGRVTSVTYKKGLFLNALRADSNVLNEHNLIVIEDGRSSIQVKQIAGLLARRIVCTVRPGDTVQRGQRIGLIKFGSRVDVLLPPDANLRVRKGERVQGGLTILAVMPPDPTAPTEVSGA